MAITAVSTHEQIIQGVVDTIKGLALSGIEDNVVGGDIPDALLIVASYPVVLVAKNGNESNAGGTNASDDILYPFVIIIIDKFPPEDRGHDDIRSLWRQVIRKKIIMQRLAGVPTVAWMAYDGGPVVNPDAMAQLKFQNVTGNMAFHARCRELRNTNP
jgi:hypothetical protein